MGKVAFDRVEGRRDLFVFKPEDVVVIGLDTKHLNKEGHILYEDSVKLPVDKGLVAAMLEQGFNDPIVVRRNGNDAEVVAGRQRVKAARRANEILRERGAAELVITAVQFKGDDGDALGAVVSENSNRRTTTFRERAENALRLQKLGKSNAQIAAYSGITTHNVAELLAFWELDPKIQRAVDADKIAGSVAAKELAKLPREVQAARMEVLLREAGEKRVTGAQVRAKRNAAEGKSDVPGKRMLKKIAEIGMSNEMSKDAHNMLLWVMGWCSADEVPGLRETLNAIEGA